MKRILITSLMIFLYGTIYCQEFGFSMGINRSNFFDFVSDDVFSSALYNSGNGYGFEVFIDELDYLGIPVGLSVEYQYLKNGFYIYNGGRWRSRAYNVDLNASQLAVNFFPLIVKLNKSRIRIKLGFQIGLILKEQKTGYLEEFNINDGTTKSDLESSTINISNDINAGIRGSLSYQIRITENWQIFPEYKYLIGLSNYVDNVFGKETKLMNHSLRIGLRKMMN